MGTDNIKNMLLKASILFAFCFILWACSESKNNEARDINDIINLLDAFNKAAAEADYDTYFNFYTEDAVFIGTDATERWDKKSFMEWAKPHFDKEKAWSFQSIQRHIYIGKGGQIGWFDELLDTQMKICRGSGVVIKADEGWKIQQYVLSMTIPNEKSDSIIKIKTALEEVLIDNLSHDTQKVH